MVNFLSEIDDIIMSDLGLSIERPNLSRRKNVERRVCTSVSAEPSALIRRSGHDRRVLPDRRRKRSGKPD